MYIVVMYTSQFNTRFYRYSASVHKMQSCYEDPQKFLQTFHSHTVDAKGLQCVDVNKPLQKWKSKTRVTSCELRVKIYELRVQIHELRVQIYEERVQIHELQVQITSYEFKYTSYEFKSMS